MRNLTRNSITKYSVFTLLALSFVFPLYSFPTAGDPGQDTVYAWEVVQQEPVMALAFLAPLLVPMLLGTRLRHGWNRIAFSVIPLILVFSASWVLLESTLSFSALKSPIPGFPVPLLWIGSSVEMGCWLFVMATALLLVTWGAAAWRRFKLRKEEAI